MKLATIVVLAALPLGAFLRETNSHATARRGVKAYEAKQYDEAVRELQESHRLAPSADSAFNLGTAKIAAGSREEGSAALTEAMRDPRLRADALYNRGNSALAANSLDHAIRDYSDALRLRPNDARAKRNLEIALSKREQSKQSGAGGQRQQGGSQPQPQQHPSTPQPDAKPPQAAPSPGQTDDEALLRSVQQQEQEELRRMKRPQRSRGRVGW